jgi:hypothetical protein
MAFYLWDKEFGAFGLGFLLLFALYHNILPDLLSSMLTSLPDKTPTRSS